MPPLLFTTLSLSLPFITRSSFGDIETGLAWADSQGQLLLVNDDIPVTDDNGSSVQPVPSPLIRANVDRMSSIPDSTTEGALTEPHQDELSLRRVACDFSNWLWFLSVACCVASLCVIGKVDYVYPATLLIVGIFSFGCSMWINCAGQEVINSPGK